MDYFADNWIGIAGLIIAAIGVWVAWRRKSAAPKTGVHQTMVNTRGSKQVAQTPNARQDMRDTTDSEQQGQATWRIKPNNPFCRVRGIPKLLVYPMKSSSLKCGERMRKLHALQPN
jgi:LPXTG-motif cell wall-anchored protein